MMFTPPLVGKALELACKKNFQNSCIPEVGQLLRVLVAGAKPGVIAEIGTGCGVSSAWMLNGLQPYHQFVSVEKDSGLHQAVLELFVSEARANFILGDWRELLKQQPFQLVFVDVGNAKDDGSNAVIEATAIGGLIILDDFTPLHLRKEQTDERREQWFSNRQLIVTEILTTLEASALLAVRVS
jgi:predicted O-methyltransferase YrrM